MIEGAPRTPEERPKEVGAPKPAMVYLLQTDTGADGEWNIYGIFSTREKAERAKKEEEAKVTYSLELLIDEWPLG